MKKIKNIFILLIFVTILVLLIGCEKNVGSNTNSTDVSGVAEQSTDNTHNTNIEGEGINSSDEMTDNIVFDFDSVQELKNWIYASENSERDDEAHEDNYSDFIVELLNEASDIYIPAINGKIMNFRTERFNICIHENELYLLPWAWYYVTYDTFDNIIIKQALLTKEKRNINSLSTSEYIEELFPGAVNVFNAEKYPHYDVIREEKINVGGNEVFAVYYQESDNDRVRYYFTYNEYLFIVWADKELFNSDFFEKLSFIPLLECCDL